MNAPRNGWRSRETTALYSTGTRSTQTATPDLRTPLQFLKGVGPRRAAQLERKGLRTVEDALFFLPLRHEDRTRLVPFRALHTGRLVPVYSLTEGLAQRALRSLMWRIVDTFAREVPEALPDAVRARRKLVTLPQALSDCHFPETDAALDAARHRLAFDDFLLLQLGLAILRSRTARARGLAMNPRGELVARLRASLPWPLTRAQERVWDEIRRDMASPFPMHRLLQGDVGSGKTIVAALAVLTAVEAGYQAAVMVPTEILAEQHFMTFRQLLEPLGVPVTLLTSSLKLRERAARRAGLAAGEISCVVGTHALVQGSVELRRLGLAVVDEQHRFGVEQRARLRGKGEHPDLLVLTATPIPRTLALTLYGDLDVSVLA